MSKDNNCDNCKFKDEKSGELALCGFFRKFVNNKSNDCKEYVKNEKGSK